MHTGISIPVFVLFASLQPIYINGRFNRIFKMEWNFFGNYSAKWKINFVLNTIKVWCLQVFNRPSPPCRHFRDPIVAVTNRSKPTGGEVFNQAPCVSMKNRNIFYREKCRAFMFSILVLWTQNDIQRNIISLVAH